MTPPAQRRSPQPPASPHVDVEEIETTRSEQTLALVLALFLLIGGLWAYGKIDDVVAGDRGGLPAAVEVSPADRAAIARLQSAQERLSRATARQAAARRELEFRREAYRTALDAGRPAAALERRYRLAEARLSRAGRALAAARREVVAARPAGTAALRRQRAAAEAAANRRELLAFVLRLAFVLVTMVVGYVLLAQLRNRESRYLPAALAFVGFAAILAFVMATDYVTDYIDPVELGPLVLSLVGVVLTLAAFRALQRYMAGRVPSRRVRKNECPFCGFPARGTERCEGCGRELLSECAACQAPRRVGTPHCGACGQA